MNFFKRLFGRSSSDSKRAPAGPALSGNRAPAKGDAPKPEARKTAGSTKPAAGKSLKMGSEWRRFFDNVPLDESAQAMMMAFVGSWPKGLDPNLFSKTNWPHIVSRIREHLTMPYPGPYLRSMPNSPRPDYRMVDGKVARASSPFIDMILVTVLPSGTSADAEPNVLVWRLIERYSQWPLARFVFLLPRIQDASEAAAGGKKVPVVIEHMLISIYTGVENALFGVYDDLPGQGRLSDKAVEDKLRSFLMPSK
jgi:hypothetical protein